MQAGSRPPKLKSLAFPSAEWLEELLGDVAANLPPEVRALLVGVEEVEAGKDVCLVDLLHHLVEALVLATCSDDPAVEREGHVVGAEECGERLRDPSAMAGVRRRILGEVRRRAQRPPGR